MKDQSWIEENIEIKVRGGFPLTVAAKMLPAEPDVGIMSVVVDDWWVTHIGKNPCKAQPDFSEQEETEIISKICEALR